MIAVPLPEAEVRAAAARPLSLAAVNAADECVVAGAADGDRGARRARSRRRGVTDAADPARRRRAQLAARSRSSPSSRGRRRRRAVAADDALHVEPHRDVDHRRAGDRPAVLGRSPPRHGALRRRPRDHARRRADGARRARPGQALSSYARRRDRRRVAAIPALRHPTTTTLATPRTRLPAFAQQWADGVDVDLDRFAGAGRRRLRLPTYPFQHERYWIEPGRAAHRYSTTPTSPPGCAGSPDESPTGSGSRLWTEAARPPSRAVALGGDLVVVGGRPRWADEGSASTGLRPPRGLDAARRPAPGWAPRRAVRSVRRDVAGLGDAVDAAGHLGTLPAPPLAVVTRGAHGRRPASRPLAPRPRAGARRPREYPDSRCARRPGGEAPAPRSSPSSSPPNGGRPDRGGRRLVPRQRRLAAPGHAGRRSARAAHTSSPAASATSASTSPATSASRTAPTSSSSPSACCCPRPSGRVARRPRPRRANEPPHPADDGARAAGSKVAIVTADLGDPAALRRALDEAEARSVRSPAPSTLPVRSVTG